MLAPVKPEAFPRAKHGRVNILGCPLDVVTMDEAVAWVDQAVTSRAPSRHVSINAAKLVKFQHDETLREAIRSCDLITADGQSVVWASRWLGRPLPERVTGIDLMERLLSLAASRGYRVFLLGAAHEVVEQASLTIRQRFPALQLAGSRHGYFTPAEEESVVETIAASAPDLLFVALETPAKELFLKRNSARLTVPFAMGVGGAFDVIAGRRRRAPAWLRGLGLEWLFRLAQDPRRLAHRYVVGNSQFVWLVARERIRPRDRGLRVDW
jgi:N-acetylglucosaminyldiphosphoundecaprenol N-acetyl-beta-D-mannosaminyltransferase